jgi:hypothetical protein
MANILQLTVRHSPDPNEFGAVDPVSKIKSWHLLAFVIFQECSVLRTVCFTKFFRYFVVDLENGPSIKQRLFFQIHKQFVISVILSIYQNNFSHKSLKCIVANEMHPITIYTFINLPDTKMSTNFILFQEESF